MLYIYIYTIIKERIKTPREELAGLLAAVFAQSPKLLPDSAPEAATNNRTTSNDTNINIKQQTHKTQNK